MAAKSVRRPCREATLIRPMGRRSRQNVDHQMSGAAQLSHQATSPRSSTWRTRVAAARPGRSGRTPRRRRSCSRRRRGRDEACEAGDRAAIEPQVSRSSRRGRRLRASRCGTRPRRFPRGEGAPARTLPAGALKRQGIRRSRARCLARRLAVTCRWPSSAGASRAGGAPCVAWRSRSLEIVDRQRSDCSIARWWRCTTAAAGFRSAALRARPREPACSGISARWKKRGASRRVGPANSARQRSSRPPAATAARRKRHWISQVRQCGRGWP